MPTGVTANIADSDENVAKVTTKGHLQNTETYDLIKNPSAIRVTSESGGVELPTVTIGKMILRSWSGNNVIFIGGVAEDAPYSGRGIPIWPNEVFTVPVNNMNAVRAFAATSGNIISVMGFGTGQNVELITNDPVTTDTTAPTIVTVSPTSGATGVNTLVSEVYANFSEALASESVNISGFTLRLSGNATNLSGLAFVDSSITERAVFSPSSGVLLSGKMYEARIGTSVTDLAGNALQVSGLWSFTTAGATADTTRPVVSGHSPVSGATSVSRSISPTFSFSEAIQSGTVNSTFFRVNISGGSALSASITLGTDLKTVTINPASDLDYSTIYQLSAFSGVKDLAGNNMNTPVTSKFTTVQRTYNQIYSVGSPDSSNTLFEGDDIGEGCRVNTSSSAIKGKIVRKLQVTMRRQGSLNDTVRAEIWTAGGIKKYEIGRIDCSDITTSSSFANYTFGPNDTATYALATDDIVLVSLYATNSNSSNYIEIKRRTSDTFDGTDTCRTHYDGAYHDETGHEFVGVMWE